MSLDYTILGVLLDEPTHGYSIKKTLSQIFSRNLGVNDGQLYPALARLEQRGWIKKRVIEQERSPTKHLYRVTDVGKKAFLDWLDAPEGAEEPTRPDFFWKDGFLQKCGFFRYLAPEAVRSHVTEKLKSVERRIAELETYLGRSTERGLDPYRRMIVEYGIRCEHMRREWLVDLLDRSMEPGLGADAQWDREEGRECSTQ